METRDSVEVEVTAAHEDYQKFLSSSVWSDMKRELEILSEMVDIALRTQDVPEIYRMQGRAEALEEALHLPERLMALLEEKFSRQALPSDEEGFYERTEVYHDEIEEFNNGNGF
jgi:L-serine deaminase